MTGFLSSILGRGGSGSERSSEPGSPHSSGTQHSPKSPSTNVWQSTFNPGRNYSNPRRNSRDYYDNVPAGTKAPSVWDQVVKAQNLQRLSFSQLDKDGDGYLSAADLKAHFSKEADVHALIDAADKNKDGRISLSEFREMMTNS